MHWNLDFVEVPLLWDVTSMSYAKYPDMDNDYE